MMQCCLERTVLPYSFRALNKMDIPLIVEAFSALGWVKPASTYQKYLQEQADGQRCIWVAFQDDTFLGYITLKWQSDYPFFRAHSIPEIKDLNVLLPFRKRGIGSQLLDRAEAEAYSRSSLVGLGVGLSTDYGNAQKLYIKRGYVPDGHGITYKSNTLHYGATTILDDDLILWLVKNANVG